MNIPRDEPRHKSQTSTCKPTKVGSTRRPAFDGTWDSSQGIRFSCPTTKAWDPSCGIQFGHASSFSSSSNAPLNLGNSRARSPYLAAEVPRTSSAPLSYETLSERSPQSRLQTASEDLGHFELAGESHGNHGFAAGEQIEVLSPPSVPVEEPRAALGLEPTFLKTPVATKHQGDATVIEVKSPNAEELLQIGQLATASLSLSSFTTQNHSFDPLPDFSSASRDHKCNDQGGSQIGHAKHEVAQAPSVSEQEPFRSPLGFHIPADKMQAALNAEPDTIPSYWQYSLYRGPNGNNQVVKVHYCKTRESMETVSQMFASEGIIGFDLEWMAQAKVTDGVKRNVSLIQIACEERIALFHIARFPRASVADDYVAPTFRNIMESPNVTKVGVAIKGDSTRLRKFLNVRCQGLFELSYLYKLIKYYPSNPSQINRWSVSLAQQVKEHLRLPLLKGDVQTSDWSKNLDYDQARYAASDSYAGFQLFHCMEAKRMALDPAPPRPAHAELNQKLSFPVQQAAGPADDLSDTVEVSLSDLCDQTCLGVYPAIELGPNSRKHKMPNSGSEASDEFEYIETPAAPSPIPPQENYGVRTTTYPSIKNAPLPADSASSDNFSNILLLTLIALIPAYFTRKVSGGLFTWAFFAVFTSLPVIILFWYVASLISPRKNEKVRYPGRPVEHYLHFRDEKDRAKYHGKAKIPMETFHEMYFDGKVEFKGDALEVMEYRHDWANFRFTYSLFRFFLTGMVPEVIMHSRSQDEEQVRDHYDRGDDFYGWFLGPRMIYTSGIISDINKEETLEQLQDNKLGVVCEKIRLKPGDNMLDIGCGWGTLAKYASTEYGAHTTGVTLGRNQTAWGNNALRKAGVDESQSKILCMDYRDTPVPKGGYNKITCLEMAEHVGVRHFHTFLAQVYDMLDDDGVFLLQIAGLRKCWQYEDLIWGLFMNKYIFPGADASTPLGWFVDKLEGAGFEVKSVDTIGVHYSATLWRWYRNWLANREKVEAKYGKRWFRIWEYFLAYSTIISRQGSATCYQITLVKNINSTHRIEGVPSQFGLEGALAASKAATAANKVKNAAGN
ncbi:MAG: hypothetical protein Q9217_004090 [Psora testacea]